jgi:uncharacterized protein involved in exopolysaccharide biosynthesis
MTVPEADRSAGLAAVSGLASQFGISLGTASTETPQFYGDLIVTPTVLDYVLSYPDSCIPAGRVLRENIAPGRTDDARAEELARRRLRKLIDIGVNARTSVISVWVRTDSPCHAQVIANAVYAGVVDYNLRVRQTRAHVRKQFAEQRYREALDSLDAIENRMRVFYEENRRWEDSPRLRLLEASLQRRVALATEIVTSLAREVEQARIAEADDIPVLSVVVKPRLPSIPADHGPKFWLVLGGLAGGAVAAMLPLVSRRPDLTAAS